MLGQKMFGLDPPLFPSVLFILVGECSFDIGYSFRYYVTDLVGEYDVKLVAKSGYAHLADAAGDGDGR